MNKKQLLIFLVTVCFMLAGCDGAFSRDTQPLPVNSITISGYTDSDGTAYIPSRTSTTVTIPGDAHWVVQTMDRQHIILLETDGRLTLFDGNGENKKVIAENINDIVAICNTGIIVVQARNGNQYYNPEIAGDWDEGTVKNFGKYTFMDDRLTWIGENLEMVVAQNSTSVAYADAAGVIYVLPDGALSEIKIGSYMLTGDLEGVSDDGSVVVWSDTDEVENICTVYLYSAGEREKALEFNNDYSFVDVRFNETSDMAIISSNYSDTLAFWSSENGISSIRLTNELSSSMIFTQQGPFFSSEPTTGDEWFYVSVENDNGSDNLYAIRADGSREKVLSSVTNVSIQDGNVFYIDADMALGCAKIDGYMLLDKMDIAHDVYDFHVSPDGTQICYAKNVTEDMVASIYYYRIGADAPTRITVNGYCFSRYYSYLEFYLNDISVYFTADGEYIYYFEDGEDTGTGYIYSGTLMRYDIKNDESTRIGTDVITDIDCEYRMEYLDADGFWYLKFMSYDSDSYVMTTDLMFWNETEAVIIARNITNDRY